MTPEEHEAAMGLLRGAVGICRRSIKTPVDHANYPTHYADERVRELLEEVIQELPVRESAHQFTLPGQMFG